MRKTQNLLTTDIMIYDHEMRKQVKNKWKR